MAEDPKNALGRIQLERRAVPAEQTTVAPVSVRERQEAVARALESGALSDVAALKLLSEQVGVPGIDIAQVCIRLTELHVLPREVALRHEILPVLVRNDRMFVAMVSPGDKKIIDELEFVTGKRVFPYVALAGALRHAIQSAYDLLDQGASFYVGPRCPPELRRKAGVDESPRAATQDAPPPVPASAAPSSAVPSSAVPSSAVSGHAFAPTHDSGSGATDHVGPTGARAATADDLVMDDPVVVDDALHRVRHSDPAAGIEDDADPSDEVVATRSLVPSSQRTVLVVDDEADIRRLLRRVLEERGYRVIEADRGLAALRMVKEQLPDILVLDAMLPEMHGFELARRLKGSRRYGQIPIIMISAVYKGWRIAEDVKTSYGVEAYIEKPFRISDVLAAVEAGASKQVDRPDVEAMSVEAERLLSEGIEAYRAGKLDEAVAFLRQGVEIDPLAYRLHLHLGLLYGKQNLVYEAISELETALTIHSKHFPLLKNLAVLYQKAGLRNKAVETWERALRFAPDDDTRTSIKQHLLTLL
jgi:DNA-binding response OmpR family regulator